MGCCRDFLSGCVADKTCRFEGSIPTPSKKEAVHLKISVAPSLAEGLDLEELKDCYKNVGKSRKNGGRVVVLTNLHRDRGDECYENTKK